MHLFVLQQLNWAKPPAVRLPRGGCVSECVLVFRSHTHTHMYGFKENNVTEMSESIMAASINVTAVFVDVSIFSPMASWMVWSWLSGPRSRINRSQDTNRQYESGVADRWHGGAVVTVPISTGSFLMLRTLVG